MTAPAAAPTSGPIAASAVRAPPQPPADAHAFADVLDSLPGGAVKAGASTAKEDPRASNEKRLDPSPEQSPSHFLLGDGSLLASLPFTLQAASSTIGEGPQSENHGSSPAPAAMKGTGSGDRDATVATNVKTTVGRLIGERAFHFGASPSAGVVTNRTPPFDAPFAASSAVGANLSARADPSGGPVSFPPAGAASIAPRPGKAAPTRVGAVQAAHEAARSGSEPTAAPPVARAASSAKTSAPAESTGRAADGRPPDPITPATPSGAQADPSGAQLSAAFGAAAPFAPDASTAGPAEIAPPASAHGAGPAPSAPPVREIDVDLSPGGLEDVSMTMRLAGDKLSLVVRAGSSQTLNSIEGARDAIADRLAAIGQPLDSLVIKQTGVNADGTGASADDGSAGDAWRSAQGGDGDASLARRGAHRDRGL